MNRRCAALLVLLGCRPMVAVPPMGPHVGDEPAEVPHPPPPARAEILPPRPADDAVWVDGHWSWTGDQYAWVPGGWQKPRPGYYYAPANTVRRRNGELLYYEGHWHAESSAAKGGP